MTSSGTTALERGRLVDRRRSGRGSVASERGTAGVGLAAGATALILLAMLAVGGLRLVAVSAAVAGAADAAAGAAARARTGPDAVATAESVVAEQLGPLGSRCRTRAVSVEPDAEPTAGAVGSPLVRVRIRCEVDLAPVMLVGFPASVVVERSSIEPVDRFRGGVLP